MFNDSFLEGAPANGIAWAIADHPKYCDWGNGKPTGGANKALGSFEVNPDAAQKVKSAVRTLRKLGENLGLSGKIGIYGFSRGSDAGSLAVGDQSVPEFENAGLYQGVSDDVQVAALGSGVFDFTKIFVKTGDGDSNLESRCPVVWGPLASNVAAWRKQGSAYLAQSSATAPVIFFYNTDDAVYYQDQIGFFKARLDSLGVPTSVITNYGTGHAVPQTAVPLDTIYKFFSKYLISDVTSVNAPEVSDNHDFQMQVSCLKDQQSVKINFFLQQSSDVKIELINLSGNIISSKNQFYASGNQSEIFNSANLPQGIYLIKLSTENSGAAVKVAIN
jgi:dienelactone hydrolase